MKFRALHDPVVVIRIDAEVLLSDEEQDVGVHNRGLGANHLAAAVPRPHEHLQELVPVLQVQDFGLCGFEKLELFDPPLVPDTEAPQEKRKTR